MPKIVLGQRPKNFKRAVKVPLLDGTLGEITVSYVYRTHSDWAAFVDALRNAAKVSTSAPRIGDDEALARIVRDAVESTRDNHADYLMQILDGWDLDVEFSRPAVVQLCDELPGVALALINQYREAITEGRAGN